MTASKEKPLREVIREILREELRQLGLIPPEPAPALSFVADVVRDEVRQALSSPGYCDVPRHLTYADAVRRPVIAPSTPPAPMPRPPPTLAQPISSPATLPTSPISPPRRMPYGRHPNTATWFNGESSLNYQPGKSIGDCAFKKEATDLVCTAL
ncbi:hypothetical protein HPB52_006037 [Rhipicephalus sanguineus]|uniref:Uncharacterized protein n=1 Tax=Rhipicephalus sanguineus TaxID=34632 RepID=A0A9D4T7P8_RHISA|nr:hypothetical protein HPB52_006037 [Rhipicephalus sanguineus]